MDGNTSMFSDNDDTILNSEDESESTSKSHSHHTEIKQQEWVPVVPATRAQTPPPVPKRRSALHGNANGNAPNPSTASSAMTNKNKTTNKTVFEYIIGRDLRKDTLVNMALELLRVRMDLVFGFLTMIIIFLLTYNLYCTNQLRNETAEQHKEVLIITQQLVQQQFQRYERNLNEKLQRHGEIQLILFKDVVKEGFETFISKLSHATSTTESSHKEDYGPSPIRQENARELSTEEEIDDQSKSSDYSFEFPSIIKESISKLFSSKQQQPPDFISNSVVNEAKIQKLKENLESMQSTYFPKQQRETWIQIWSAVSLTLETSLINSVASPARPASIVILQKESSKNIGHCFMKILAKNINNAISDEEVKDYKAKELSPEYFSSLSSPTTINDDILDHLQHKGKVIQIDRVNEIQRVSHLYIFHSLCDNYMAPDPKAVFLFLITIPTSASDEQEGGHSWTHGNGMEIVRKFLSKSWENVLDEDKRAPLIVRIAANVVLIQNDGEDSKVLNSSECF